MERVAGLSCLVFWPKSAQLPILELPIKNKVYSCDLFKGGELKSKLGLVLAIFEEFTGDLSLRLLSLRLRSRSERGMLPEVS